MAPRRGRQQRKPPSVSASELAQMGRCEKLVVFEHLHGNRRTDSQQRDRKRGVSAHEQFEREGLDAMSAAARPRGRCFVATCVFGDAWQTRVLRRFRDEVLRSRPWGRWLIRRYYLAGPGLCVVLRRWPVLQGTARAVLGLAAVALHWWLRRSGETR
ncbi:MAG: hypothetical protein KGK18_16055 [Burkholderiales bacterium]|nr:hypothetical protein [Burkholderiales bacterium]